LINPKVSVRATYIKSASNAASLQVFQLTKKAAHLTD